MFNFSFYKNQIPIRIRSITNIFIVLLTFITNLFPYLFTNLRSGFSVSIKVLHKKTKPATTLKKNTSHIFQNRNVTQRQNSNENVNIKILPPQQDKKKIAKMQLLHENTTLLMSVRERNMSTNMSVRELSDTLEVKEKRSSDASLLMMNPVASGDNVTTGLNSTHRLKEELPPLVPCCEGRELQINEDLVRSGLSAISVKHDSVIQCLSMSRACERMQIPPGLVKHRNSFRSLHRPDLKRVPYLRRMSPDELETLFRGYADLPPKTMPKTDFREEKPIIPPHENGQEKEKIEAKEICRPDEENRSGGPEDVPAGMRLHGARARLYTSVLAGAKAGDQPDAISNQEDYDTRVPDDPVPDEEVQLNEELQIILPPRYDDVTADSSITATEENSIS